MHINQIVKNINQTQQQAKVQGLKSDSTLAKSSPFSNKSTANKRPNFKPWSISFSTKTSK